MSPSNTTGSYPLLDEAATPPELRRMRRSQLTGVADDLRRYLVDSVSQSGGHFAAGLGVVELTVALHYVYNTPEDRIVWDVGHQAYPHKVLTGRRDRLATVRQWEGLTPFPKRVESEYDTFGVGHAGTSIGAALGMALAAERTGSGRKAVAVIGDGGLTCGQAFEALNHAGGVSANMLVVLNDNEMSISPNVGALTRTFSRVLSGRIYSSFRDTSERVMSRMPSPVWELAQRAESHAKGMIVPGSLFEEFGFNYIGPIDGHDMDALVSTLQNLRARPGPQLLHIATKKGKGYRPAEREPTKYHGISAPFDPAKGIEPSGKASAVTYSTVFGDWLCDMAAKDPRIVGITPAMREGSKMERFEQEYPGRYFDVGIAEQHSVTLAAGMACDGLKPVVAIYSTFLQRAFDQAAHDVDIQKLPVIYAIDRAGLVGGDGPTHAGSFDITFLRCLPNTVVMAPADEDELRQMLYTATTLDQPVAVRYPRGGGPGVAVNREMSVVPLAKAEVRREGKDIAILSFGPMLDASLEAGDSLDATVVNMRYVKPLDETLVASLARSHRLLVTVDENAVAGGAGSAVNEYLASVRLRPEVLNLGLPDRYIQQGGRSDMLRDAGLDRNGILASIERFRAQSTDTNVTRLAR